MLRPVCVQIHTYNFQTSVCVCVSVCVHASRSGEQMEARGQQCRYRSWESSHGAASPGEVGRWRLGPRLEDWCNGTGLFLNITLSSCLWLRLPVCGSHRQATCLSGVPVCPSVCLYAHCDCCPESLKGFFMSPSRPFFELTQPKWL